MKISCADYTWPRLAHDLVCAIVANLGCDGIDIGVFGDSTHVTVDQVVLDPVVAAKEVTKRVRSHGLQIADVFLTPGNDLAALAPTNPSKSDQARSMAIFRQAALFAAELDVPGITILPGIRHGRDSVDAALERAAQGLGERSAIAASFGLQLSIEPHAESCVDTPTRIAKLLDLLPNLMLTLDPAHLIYAGFRLIDFAEFLDRTRHIQLRPGAKNKMQVRVKESELDFEFLLSALSARRYQGWLACEYVWMEKWECDRVDNTTETADLVQLLRSYEQAGKA